MWELDCEAEHQRIDAFELWCWEKLLRVPWTARRSHQSIIKEISPECSLEGLMLKLKLQYFGHLIWIVDSLEKTQMLGRIGGRQRRRWQSMRSWDDITNSMDMGLGRQTGRPGMLRSWSHRVRHDWPIELNWTEWSSGFPAFFKSKFGNKELVIWVRSGSCFCWLYRASPSLAAKNITNLINIINLVMSMCRVFSCAFGKGCLLWPVCSLDKTLSAFSLLHSVSQGQICLLL